MPPNDQYIMKIQTIKTVWLSMVLRHQKNEYYKSKEARADAFNNGDYEGDFSLGDFADNGIDTHDLEWQLTDPTAYRIVDKSGRESIRNLQNAVKNPRRLIKIWFFVGL